MNLTNRQKKSLALGGLLSLIVFIIAMYMSQSLTFATLEGDAPEYHAIAVNLHHNYNFGTAYRFPLYSMFIAVSYTITHDAPEVLRIPQAILCSITILFLFGTALNIFKKLSLATVAVLMFMLDFNIFKFTELLYTENLFIPLVLIFYYLRQRLYNDKNQKNLLLSFLAGLVIALSVMTRGQGVFILVAYIIYDTFKERLIPLWGKYALIILSILMLAWNIKIFTEMKHIPIFTTGTGGVLYGSHSPSSYRLVKYNGKWKNSDLVDKNVSVLI